MNDLIKAGFAIERIAELAASNAGGCDINPYAFANHGFAVLGRGAYGYVLAVPDCQYVIKVCRDPTDGYIMFAKWAMANPMPGLPAFKQVTQVGGEHGITYIVMPRLSDLTSVQRNEVLDARWIAPGQTTAGMNKAQKQLAVALKCMREALGAWASEDTHLGNFMYDPTRDQYVVTDPYTTVYSGGTAHELTDRIGQMAWQLELSFEVQQETCIADEDDALLRELMDEACAQPSAAAAFKLPSFIDWAAVEQSVPKIKLGNWDNNPFKEL